MDCFCTLYLGHNLVDSACYKVDRVTQTFDHIAKRQMRALDVKFTLNEVMKTTMYLILTVVFVSQAQSNTGSDNPMLKRNQFDPLSMGRRVETRNMV